MIDLRLPNFPGRSAESTRLVLKRANAPPARPVWKDDDYDVLADGKVRAKAGT